MLPACIDCHWIWYVNEIWTRHRQTQESQRSLLIIITYLKVVDFTRLAGLLRGSTNQKATGSNPVGCTTNRWRASRRWRFFFLLDTVGFFPASRPVRDESRSGIFVMCWLLLFQVIRPIITNLITITSVRHLIFPDAIWFFRGSALSQIVSHRPENVADQAPSRNDVILPFVGIAVKGHFDVGMARDGL